MRFRILSEISHIETIAAGRGIHERSRLVRNCGFGNWRKRKGIASVRLPDGAIVQAELHWYEAHGIGKREMKLKRRLN